MDREERERLEGEEGPAQEAPDGDPTSVEETASRLEEAEREKEQFRRLLQRVQADFANFRKRSEEERREYEQQANARLVMKLLPIMDEFELAVSQAKEFPADEAWLEGVKLIYRNVSSVLESEGMARIQALGKQFDPFEHEAMVHQESEEEPEGKVLAVIRGGYKLHGKVLRPAQVVVAKAVSPIEKEESPANEEENSNA